MLAKISQNFDSAVAEMKKRLSVGQTVWLEPVGYRARNSKIVETTITHIKQKYFTVAFSYYGTPLEFRVDNLGDLYQRVHNNEKEDSKDWRVYLSLEDLKAKNERIKLMKVADDFAYSNKRSKLSLDQLRRYTELIAQFEEENNQPKEG